MKKVVVILFLLIYHLSAQTLLLQDAIEKAIQTHPDIQSFLLRQEQSEKAVNSEKSIFYPQLLLHGNYDLIHTYVIPQQGSFNTKDENGWSGGISLHQKIWDFQKSNHLIKAAKKNKEITALLLKDAQNLMKTKVKSIYVLLILNQKAIEIYKSNLKSKEAFYKQARALRKQGLKTKIDESRFFAALQEAKESLSKAKSTYRKSKIDFELLIGEQLTQDTTLDIRLLQKPAFNIQEIARLERKMLKTNPKLHIKVLQEKQNRIRYLATKEQNYGSIDLAGDLSHIDTLSAYDSKSLSLQYNAPIFSGGKIRSEAQKLKIAAQISQQEYASFKKILLKEFRGYIEDLKSLTYAIKTLEAQINVAQENKKLLLARYKAGLSTYIEILDADALYLKANLALLQTYLQIDNTLYQIEYLTGESDDHQVE